MKIKQFIAGLALGASLFTSLTASAQIPQQCVTNALAGGTGDAITVPLLPCALTTNILILTLSGTNATTSPTLQMAGYPALPILTASGGTIDIGALSAGSVALLTGTGQSWLLLTNGVNFASPISVPEGGTGDTSLTNHGVLTGAGTSPVVVTAAGTTGQFLGGNTGAAPTFQALSGSTVTSLSFGSLGLTPNSATSGAITVGGTLVVANGGTGQSNLTSHSVLIGAGTSAITQSAVGATGTVLSGNTGADPTFQAISGLAVSSISFGSTGLTPNSATAGAVTVAGTLGVPNGGSGVATITGMIKGNGASAFTAGTAGTDYVAPGTPTTFTATQTFNGSSSVKALALKNASEPATISATAATGTINYDVTTQSVLYYTSNASANWTVNFRGSSGTSLNTLMSTGDVVTVVFQVTQGGTAFFNSAVQVDGTTSGVTTIWQGGNSPVAGNINSVDVYSYAIEKTGSATYTILAAQTQFK